MDKDDQKAARYRVLRDGGYTHDAAIARIEATGKVPRLRGAWRPLYQWPRPVRWVRWAWWWTQDWWRWGCRLCRQFFRVFLPGWWAIRPTSRLPYILKMGEPLARPTGAPPPPVYPSIGRRPGPVALSAPAVDRFIPQRDAAAYLGVSVSYLRASSCPKVLLPGTGPRGKPLVRYRLADLDAWAGAYRLTPR